MVLVDVEGWLVPVVEVCELLVPWFIVDDEPMSVDDWVALTELLVELLPLPTFTPGLMFAPAFRSVLETPTLALIPTFGSTLIDEPSGVLEVLELDGVVDEVELDGLVEELELDDDGWLDELVPEVVPDVLPLRFAVPEVLPLRLVLPDV